MKKRLSIFLALLGALCAAGQESAAPDEPITLRDAEGIYAQARTMLEDRTIQNVSAVPMMLEDCARVGYEPAKMLLLDVYEGTRKGLETRPAKAYELACSMAEDAHVTPEAQAEAMYRRALYLERGFGCHASPAEAYRWMKQAANAGLHKARVELARYLMNGVGHEPAPSLALHHLLYVYSLAPDTPNLCFYLGHMCMLGKGMARPNRLMARRFFELGAQKNDARAMNNLASMYELGIGVSKDTNEALRLYKRAAALGSKEASANMQRLAYKTDIAPGASTPWQQRVGSAAVRVIQALPLSPLLRPLLEEPFLHLAAPES